MYTNIKQDFSEVCILILLTHSRFQLLAWPRLFRSENDSSLILNNKFGLLMSSVEPDYFPAEPEKKNYHDGSLVVNKSVEK